jgi:predicted esterase
MKQPDYIKMGDRDYHEIDKRFHARKEKEWDKEKPGDAKNPLLFDEMPLWFQEQWPVLKEYCIYNLRRSSEETKHYLLGHLSYKCEHRDFGPESVKEPEPCDLTVKDQLPSDEQVSENLTFRCPLVRKQPSSNEPAKCERVTILLHGLNEYSYHKYIPWACQIALNTEMPFLLFPLTFSITRACREWGNIKGDIRVSRQNIYNAGPFNAIISERLQARPERFFWGAVQSYWDLVNFVREIRDNENAHIAPDARIDFLGFSSGGYLALALLLANPENLFNTSRACLFSTCVEMRSLGPGSPYIVDSDTERALQNIYVENITTLPNERMAHWFEEHPEGYWLRTFGGFPPERQPRVEGLQKIALRLLAVANNKDRVMPPGAMLDALQGDERSTKVPFVYLNLGIHENPFVCPDYKPNRKYLIKYIEQELYGGEFEKFIDSVSEHLNRSLSE